jgi:hypothetical protein
MSDVVDLSFISGLVQGLDQEMRLLRLQVDNLAGGIPPRLAVIEQSFHELTGEVARGFGQMQQQFSRQEQRLNALDAGLGKLAADLAESTERIIREIRANAR